MKKLIYAIFSILITVYGMLLNVGQMNTIIIWLRISYLKGQNYAEYLESISMIIKYDESVEF